MIRKHFRLKRLVLGLAFAALLAPAAQATPYAPGSGRVIERDLSVQVSPYEVRGTHVLPGGMTLSTAQGVRSENSLGNHTTSVGSTGVSAPSLARSENSLGSGGPNTIGATNPVIAPAISTASADVFDWSDAAIGGSIVFGVALALLTAFALARRNRDRTRLASA
jgi:hypothetical protein